MNNQIQSKIIADFIESELTAALNELQSITLQHVMAESQFNLDNTWFAILKLSKGNLNELRSLVKAAKVDFRDVIYWATLEK
jgi:hypothetical protein